MPRLTSSLVCQLRTACDPALRPAPSRPSPVLCLLSKTKLCLLDSCRCSCLNIPTRAEALQLPLTPGVTVGQAGHGADPFPNLAADWFGILSWVSPSCLLTPAGRKDLLSLDLGRSGRREGGERESGSPQGSRGCGCGSSSSLARRASAQGPAWTGRGGSRGTKMGGERGARGLV